MSMIMKQNAIEESIQSSENGEKPVEKLSIWSSILRDVKSSAKKAPSTKCLVVLGDNESGRTTLIAKLQGNNDPKRGAGLEYHYIDVKDDDQDDTPKLGVWILDGDIACSAPLLKFAIKSETIENTTLMLVASMTQPWSLLATLKKWTTLIEEHIDRLGIDPARLREMHDHLQNDFQHYIEPNDVSLNITVSTSPTTIQSSTTSVNPKNGDEQIILPLDDGILTKSLGIPVIIVITKCDVISTLEKENDYNDEHFDFLQHYIRKFCLEYGAALFYTSVKEKKNIDQLYKYIVHKCYGYPFMLKASIAERDTIFIPAGWDNSNKANILLENLHRLKSTDNYSDVFVKPASRRPLKRDHEIIMAEDDQEFLSKLQLTLNRVSSPTRTDENITSTPTRTSAITGMASSQTPSTTGRSRSLQNAPSSTGANEGALANFFNSLINKKSGGAVTPTGVNTPVTQRQPSQSPTTPSSKRLQQHPLTFAVTPPPGRTRTPTSYKMFPSSINMESPPRTLSPVVEKQPIVDNTSSNSPTAIGTSLEDTRLMKNLKSTENHQLNMPFTESLHENHNIESFNDNRPIEKQPIIEEVELENSFSSVEDNTTNKERSDDEHSRSPSNDFFRSQRETQDQPSEIQQIASFQALNTKVMDVDEHPAEISLADTETRSKLTSHSDELPNDDYQYNVSSIIQPKLSFTIANDTHETSDLSSLIEQNSSEILSSQNPDNISQFDDTGALLEAKTASISQYQAIESHKNDDQPNHIEEQFDISKQSLNASHRQSTINSLDSSTLLKPELDELQQIEDQLLLPSTGITQPTYSENLSFISSAIELSNKSITVQQISPESLSFDVKQATIFNELEQSESSADLQEENINSLSSVEQSGYTLVRRETIDTVLIANQDSTQTEIKDKNLSLGSNTDILQDDSNSFHTQEKHFLFTPNQNRSLEIPNSEGLTITSDDDQEVSSQWTEHNSINTENSEIHTSPTFNSTYAETSENVQSFEPHKTHELIDMFQKIPDLPTIDEISPRHLLSSPDSQSEPLGNNSTSSVFEELQQIRQSESYTTAQLSRDNPLDSNQLQNLQENDSYPIHNEKDHKQAALQSPMFPENEQSSQIVSIFNNDDEQKSQQPPVELNQYEVESISTPLILQETHKNNLSMSPMMQTTEGKIDLNQSTSTVQSTENNEISTTSLTFKDTEALTESTSPQNKTNDTSHFTTITEEIEQINPSRISVPTTQIESNGSNSPVEAILEKDHIINLSQIQYNPEKISSPTKTHIPLTEFLSNNAPKSAEEQLLTSAATQNYRDEINLSSAIEREHHSNQKQTTTTDTVLNTTALNNFELINGIQRKQEAEEKISQYAHKCDETNLQTITHEGSHSNNRTSPTTNIQAGNDFDLNEHVESEEPATQSTTRVQPNTNNIDMPPAMEEDHHCDPPQSPMLDRVVESDSESIDTIETEQKAEENIPANEDKSDETNFLPVMEEEHHSYRAQPSKEESTAQNDFNVNQGAEIADHENPSFPSVQAKIEETYMSSAIDPPESPRLEIAAPNVFESIDGSESEPKAKENTPPVQDKGEETNLLALTRKEHHPDLPDSVTVETGTHSDFVASQFVKNSDTSIQSTTEIQANIDEATMLPASDPTDYPRLPIPATNDSEWMYSIESERKEEENLSMVKANSEDTNMSRDTDQTQSSKLELVGIHVSESNESSGSEQEDTENLSTVPVDIDENNASRVSAPPESPTLEIRASNNVNLIQSVDSGEQGTQSSPDIHTKTEESDMPIVTGEDHYSDPTKSPISEIAALNVSDPFNPIENRQKHEENLSTVQANIYATNTSQVFCPANSTALRNAIQNHAELSQSIESEDEGKPSSVPIGANTGETNTTFVPEEHYQSNATESSLLEKADKTNSEPIDSLAVEQKYEVTAAPLPAKLHATDASAISDSVQSPILETVPSNNVASHQTFQSDEEGMQTTTPHQANTEQTDIHQATHGEHHSDPTEAPISEAATSNDLEAIDGLQTQLKENETTTPAQVSIDENDPSPISYQPNVAVFEDATQDNAETQHNFESDEEGMQSSAPIEANNDDTNIHPAAEKDNHSDPTEAPISEAATSNDLESIDGLQTRLKEKETTTPAQVSIDENDPSPKSYQPELSISEDATQDNAETQHNFESDEEGMQSSAPIEANNDDTNIHPAAEKDNHSDPTEAPISEGATPNDLEAIDGLQTQLKEEETTALAQVSIDENDPSPISYQPNVAVLEDATQDNVETHHTLERVEQETQSSAQIEANNDDTNIHAAAQKDNHSDPTEAPISEAATSNDLEAVDGLQTQLKENETTTPAQVSIDENDPSPISYQPNVAVLEDATQDNAETQHNFESDEEGMQSSAPIEANNDDTNIHPAAEKDNHSDPTEAPISEGATPNDLEAIDGLQTQLKEEETTALAQVSIDENDPSPISFKPNVAVLEDATQDNAETQHNFESDEEGMQSSAPIEANNDDTNIHPAAEKDNHSDPTEAPISEGATPNDLEAIDGLQTQLKEEETTTPAQVSIDENDPSPISYQPNVAVLEDATQDNVETHHTLERVEQETQSSAQIEANNDDTNIHAAAQKDNHSDPTEAPISEAATSNDLEAIDGLQTQLKEEETTALAQVSIDENDPSPISYQPNVAVLEDATQDNVETHHTLERVEQETQSSAQIEANNDDTNIHAAAQKDNHSDPTEAPISEAATSNDLEAIDGLQTQLKEEETTALAQVSIDENDPSPISFKPNVAMLEDATQDNADTQHTLEREEQETQSCAPIEVNNDDTNIHPAAEKDNHSDPTEAPISEGATPNDLEAIDGLQTQLKEEETTALAQVSIDENDPSPISFKPNVAVLEDATQDNAEAQHTVESEEQETQLSDPIEGSTDETESRLAADEKYHSDASESSIPETATPCVFESIDCIDSEQKAEENKPRVEDTSHESDSCPGMEEDHDCDPTQSRTVQMGVAHGSQSMCGFERECEAEEDTAVLENNCDGVNVLLGTGEERIADRRTSETKEGGAGVDGAVWINVTKEKKKFSELSSPVEHPDDESIRSSVEKAEHLRCDSLSPISGASLMSSLESSGGVKISGEIPQSMVPIENLLVEASFSSVAEAGKPRIGLESPTIDDGSVHSFVPMTGIESNREQSLSSALGTDVDSVDNNELSLVRVMEEHVKPASVLEGKNEDSRVQLSNDGNDDDYTGVVSVIGNKMQDEVITRSSIIKGSMEENAFPKVDYESDQIPLSSPIHQDESGSNSFSTDNLKLKWSNGRLGSLDSTLLASYSSTSSSAASKDDANNVSVLSVIEMGPNDTRYSSNIYESHEEMHQTATEDENQRGRSTSAIAETLQDKSLSSFSKIDQKQDYSTPNEIVQNSVLSPSIDHAEQQPNMEPVSTVIESEHQQSRTVSPIIREIVRTNQSTSPTCEEREWNDSHSKSSIPKAKDQNNHLDMSNLASRIEEIKSYTPAIEHYHRDSKQISFTDNDQMTHLPSDTMLEHVSYPKEHASLIAESYDLNDLQMNSEQESISSSIKNTDNELEYDMQTSTTHIIQKKNSISEKNDDQKALHVLNMSQSSTVLSDHLQDKQSPELLCATENEIVHNVRENKLQTRTVLLEKEDHAQASFSINNRKNDQEKQSGIQSDERLSLCTDEKYIDIENDETSGQSEVNRYVLTGDDEQRENILLSSSPIEDHPLPVITKHPSAEEEAEKGKLPLAFSSELLHSEDHSLVANKSSVNENILPITLNQKHNIVSPTSAAQRELANFSDSSFSLRPQLLETIESISSENSFSLDHHIPWNSSNNTLSSDDPIANITRSQSSSTLIRPNTLPFSPNDHDLDGLYLSNEYDDDENEVSENNEYHHKSPPSTTSVEHHYTDLQQIDNIAQNNIPQDPDDNSKPLSTLEKSRVKDKDNNDVDSTNAKDHKN